MKRLFALYADAMDNISVFVGQACSVLFFACIAISALEVVLRYGFGSGIDISEELSRFFFVWLIFLGAIVAMRALSSSMLHLD